MKFKFILVLALLGVALTVQPLAAQSQPSLYYYYQGTRVPLTINPSLVAVQFDPASSPAQQNATINATGAIESFNANVQSPLGVRFLPLRSGASVQETVALFNGQTGVLHASPVYDYNGAQLAETTEFLVRFKSTLTSAQIAAINLANDVVSLGAQPHSEHVVILTTASDNPRGAREMANRYVEMGWVEFAEPNFVIRQTRPHETAPESSEIGSLTPNDPRFGLQWALKNTRQFLGAIAGADINAPAAWGVTQGATPIKIAVIDEGVDAQHQDLSGKVLSGYNALNNSNNTSPHGSDHHGTAAAGIAAASTNNGVGIAGVCWYCQILPVKVAEEAADGSGTWITSTAALAAGVDWAWQNGADVLSNSWTMNAPSDDVQLSVINARLSGRGGKGSTLVFAAGNANSGTVAFPASLNSYVIAVGASNWCDQRKRPASDACNNNDAGWGSNYGSALDLVAPGEAVFTTCSGGNCSNGQYTYFAGSSASTPLVSGAAALLYSLNPNLTPDQVQNALQLSARDIGSAGRDDETGYGRIDAYRAMTSLYDVTLSMKVGKVLARPGDTVAYTIKYGNQGMTAMGATTISVPVPPGMSYYNSSPAFTVLNNTAKLNVGILPANATGSAVIRFKPTQAGAGKTVTVLAEIEGAFPEINPNNNTASAEIKISKTSIYLPFLERAFGE